VATETPIGRRNTMATKKAKMYKVEYKNLVREIRKTLKALKKIQKKVSGKQQEDIALQIKSLNFLQAVCAAPTAKMSLCNIAPKMSKCNMVAAKMSKLYTNT
jgi:hypothetical protein